MTKLQTGYILFAVLTVLVFISTSSVSVTLGFLFLFGTPLFFMKALPAYSTHLNYFNKYIFLLLCTFIFVFLITPILIIMPLSFNAEPYFTFTEGMLSFDSAAYSFRWYQDIFSMA